MSDKETGQGDVTVQPSISTEEAAQTEVVGSPVGDAKATVGKEPLTDAAVDEPEPE